MTSTARTLMFLAAGAAAALVVPASDANAQSATPKATTVAVTPGAVQGLTPDQCKLLKGHLAQHIRVVGRENVSDEFFKAMGDFAFKNGCTTPVSIPVVGGKLKDLDVFNSIGSIMEQTQGINLRKLGITTVLRTASLQ